MGRNRSVVGAAVVGVVIAAGVTPSAQAAPGPRVAVTSATVTLTVPTRVEAGQRFETRGTAPAGSKVQLQWLAGANRWIAISDAVTVDKGGSYTLRARFSAAGVQSVRTVATKGRAVSTSASRRIVTLAWFNVADGVPVHAKGYIHRGIPVAINGRLYPRSISKDWNSGRQVAVSWNVNRACSDFRATMGVSDSAASDALGRYEVRADDFSLAENSMTFGKSENVFVDVSGALRLTLILEGFASKQVAPTFGTPQVLCWKNPFESNR